MAASGTSRVSPTPVRSTLRPGSAGWATGSSEWLCGRAAHDATSLSIAYFCDPATGRENPEVLALLGLSKERLPDLLEARERAGGLLSDVARELGIPSGIPVGPAVHDQYAAALGCGATSAGDVMFGAGTAWVLLAMDDRMPRPLSGWSLIGRHPVPGLHGLMVSLGNGGSAFAWARDLLGLKGAGEADLDARIARGRAGQRRPALPPAAPARRRRRPAARRGGTPGRYPARSRGSGGAALRAGGAGLRALPGPREHADGRRAAEPARDVRAVRPAAP